MRDAMEAQTLFDEAVILENRLFGQFMVARYIDRNTELANRLSSVRRRAFARIMRRKGADIGDAIRAFISGEHDSQRGK